MALTLLSYDFNHNNCASGINNFYILTSIQSKHKFRHIHNQVKMSKARSATDQIVKLIVGAGNASPSPPVGPALGSKGVKSMDFCKVCPQVPITSMPLITLFYTDKSARNSTPALHTSNPALLSLHALPFVQIAVSTSS